VQGLQKHERNIAQTVLARSVQIEDDDVLQRAELTFNPGPGARELHIYEAYWAPLTEGNVNVWDAIRFLISGGLNGIVKSGRAFWRYLFSNKVQFKVPASSTIGIGLVTLAVAALLLFNFVAAGVVIQGWWQDSNSSQLLNDLITVIALVVINLVAYGLVLLLSWSTKAQPNPSPSRYAVARAFSAIAYPAIFGALAASIAGGLLLILVTIRQNIPDLNVEPFLASWRFGFAFWSFVAAGVIAAVGLAITHPVQRWQILVRTIGHLGGMIACALLVITAGCLVLPHLPLDGLFTFLRRRGVSDVFFFGAIGAYAIAVVISYIRPASVILTVLMIVLAALAFPLLVYVIVVSSIPSLPEVRVKVLYLAPWIGVIAAGYLVRGFLVRYIGDVAAYVSSHKLDRFTEVRRKIRETAENVFRTVYLQKENNQPYYRQVAVVGHSLGSVIAFDALNAMLLEENLHPESELRVVDRTTLLLTFGSPLDKIAYVYSTLSTETDMTREALAGAAKPLISEPATRANLAWINLWSPNDVIGGPLNYYDPPASPPIVPPVVNVRDPDATTPVVAHGEYYEHPLLYDLIAAWHQA
jgi:MFS family permease